MKMKRIKLFEAFRNVNKIDKVNFMLYYWAIRTWIEENELKTHLSFDKYEKKFRFAIYGPPLHIEYFSDDEMTIMAGGISLSLYNRRVTRFLSEITTKPFVRSSGLHDPRNIVVLIKKVIKKMYEDEKNKTI